jgi:hypothetical protein
MSLPTSRKHAKVRYHATRLRTLGADCIVVPRQSQTLYLAQPKAISVEKGVQKESMPSISEAKENISTRNQVRRHQECLGRNPQNQLKQRKQYANYAV